MVTQTVFIEAGNGFADVTQVTLHCAGSVVDKKLSRQKTKPRCLNSGALLLCRKHMPCKPLWDWPAGRSARQCRAVCSLPVSVALLCRRQQQRHRHAGALGALGIGATGENDRHPGARHDAGGIGVGKKAQLFGEDVGFRSGTSRISASPATLDSIFLMRAATLLIALSIASGPSSSPPVSAAIGHFAQRRGIGGRWHLALTVSTAARIATFGVSTPSARARSMAFCAMCTFVFQRRRDVDRGIGDEQRLVVGRHVHHRIRG